MNILLHLFFRILHGGADPVQKRHVARVWQNTHRDAATYAIRIPIKRPTDKPWKSILHPITTLLQGRYRSVTFRSWPNERLATIGVREANALVLRNIRGAKASSPIISY